MADPYYPNAQILVTNQRVVVTFASGPPALVTIPDGLLTLGPLLPAAALFDGLSWTATQARLLRETPCCRSHWLTPRSTVVLAAVQARSSTTAAASIQLSHDEAIPSCSSACARMLLSNA